MYNKQGHRPSQQCRGRCMGTPDTFDSTGVWALSHNFVGLNLRNYNAHIDNRKKIVKQQYLLHMSLQCGELRPTSG